MKTNIDVAIEAGLFQPKKGTIIPIEEANNYPPNKMVVLMTGAQGEEFAALNRAANKSNTKFSLHKGDTIILSASIVPGNELQVQKMKDGMAEENIVVPDNGSIIEISPDGQKMTARKEKAPSGAMMVDGTSISDTQDVVIRDRVMLAQDGMFVIIALLDQKTGKLKKSPDLISRGFVYLKENQELLRQVRI